MKRRSTRTATLMGCAVVFACGFAGAQATWRVSIDSFGGQGIGDSSDASISGDGRFVAFESDAPLVPGDNNGKRDIFVHDRKAETTTRVSVNSTGQGGDEDSLSPSISADGRFVAFESKVTNLVLGDTNMRADVFVHDRQTGMTTRVSVDSSGAQGNKRSRSPSISADGCFVAFLSYASNLVTGDTNLSPDVFVHDRQTEITTRVSVNSLGEEGNTGGGGIPSISSDGLFVAFSSNSSNLVSSDTDGWFDVFVHDRQTGITTRVSVDSLGVQGNRDSSDPSISGDGRFVAFNSKADNLVPLDTNGRADVFVHDRETETTTRVSVNSTGQGGDEDSLSPSISADGCFVAFSSDASNLVSDDTNSSSDVFAYDLQTRMTTRVSVDSLGVPGNGDSSDPSISGDGLFVAFHSQADNLVPGDTNGNSDVFVHGPPPRGGVGLSADDGAPNDWFGAAVSFHNSAALVGAYLDDDLGEDSGSAYVFRFDGGDWGQEQKLTASDGAAGDWFGVAVALENDVALVGACEDDAPLNSGAAYVFRFDGTSFLQEQKLKASVPGSEDRFGASVSLSGNAALIGAYRNEEAASGAGAAYVFRFDGTTWVQEQQLTASDAQAGDQFGWAVSFEGDLAVVGAHFDDDQGPQSGSAYVFRFDGTSWVEQQKLLPRDGLAGQTFGQRLALSGDLLLVAACGAAYVYRFDGSRWIEEQRLTDSRVGCESDYGSAVAVLEDCLAVGAAGRLGVSKGRVVTYRFDGVTWSLEEILRGLGPMDQLGTALDADGDVLLAGAPGSEQAYVFGEPRLFLDISPTSAKAGDELVMVARPGQPAAPCALLAVELAGVPTSVLLAVDVFDQHGSWQRTAEVPPGLSGLWVSLQAFGVGVRGRVEATDSVTVVFE